MSNHHLHIALGVRDVSASRTFYAQVFDLEPDKVTADYVRFVLADPPLILSLNAAPKARAGTRVEHLGVRFGSAESFREARDRLRARGLARKEQEGITCCHAVQDKVWVRDPDGNDWEFYDLLEDLEVPAPAAQAGAAKQGGCCS